MTGAPSSRTAPKSPAARSSDPYQRILAIAFGVSLLVHVGAFVALAYSPARPKVIQPTVIQGTLVDESDLTIPSSPPAAREPERPPAPEPPPEPVEKPPEPKVEPVPVPDEEPEERKPPPREKPPVKRPTPRPPPEPKPRELTTQEKIDAMAARRAERTGTTTAEVAGAPSGSGNLSGFCEVRMGIYVDEMLGRVRSAWAYPGLDRRLETHVGLELNRSGEVLRDWVELRSGDTLFDDSVKRAIRRTAPFPPLPTCVKKTRTTARLIFRSWEDGQ